MSTNKTPPTSELYGQQLPPVADTFTPQEMSDMDAQAEAKIRSEAQRAALVEKFMLLPMAQKHRATYIATREVREVSVYVHREIVTLVRELSVILPELTKRVEELEATVLDLTGQLDAMTKAESGPEAPQLSLSLDPVDTSTL